MGHSIHQKPVSVVGNLGPMGQTKKKEKGGSYKMSVGWSFCCFFFFVSHFRSTSSLISDPLLNVNDSGCNKEELMKMSRDCMNDHILYERLVVAGNILV